MGAMRWLWLAALVACGGKDGIDFPSTLGPLEDNVVPSLDASDRSERIVFASGKTDGRYWAHARAYVHGTPTQVLAALEQPRVLVDRREVDEWEVSWNTVPEYDLSLTLHQKVKDVITVEYDMTWVMERQGYDGDGLSRVAAQWDKTDGTTFIDLLTGSLVASAAVGGDTPVTELDLVTWLEAPLRDEQTLVSFLRDLHDDITAHTAGEPLPAY